MTEDGGVRYRDLMQSPSVRVASNAIVFLTLILPCTQKSFNAAPFVTPNAHPAPLLVKANTHTAAEAEQELMDVARTQWSSAKLLQDFPKAVIAGPAFRSFIEARFNIVTKYARLLVLVCSFILIFYLVTAAIPSLASCGRHSIQTTAGSSSARA